MMLVIIIFLLIWMTILDLSQFNRKERLKNSSRF